MKKLLRSKRSGDPHRDAVGEREDARSYSDSHSAASLTATVESLDSLRDLQPMFGASVKAEGVGADRSADAARRFTNDHLNLNPVILHPTAASPSVLTADSQGVSKVFLHSARSASTRQSLAYSRDHRALATPYEGQPLKVMGVVAESELARPAAAGVADRIHRLYEDVSYVVSQHGSSLINLTSAVVSIIDCLKRFTQFAKAADGTWHHDSYNNANVRKVLKIYLHLHDNLLQDEVYLRLRLLLVKNFNDFARTLSTDTVASGDDVVKKPQNYAVGINGGQPLPNQQVLSKIVDRIAHTALPVKEQNGAFIAPITRGISAKLNVLCLYFGNPSPTAHHRQLVRQLHDLYDDVHFICVANQIELAAQVERPAVTQFDAGLLKSPSRYAFKLPFRLPQDISRPPMSMSLSVENSLRTLGTLGGYIYPMIDVQQQPELASYASYSYAVTCGHVCLSNNSDENKEYSNVSVPLSVLISLYKQALLSQYAKLDESTAGGVSPGAESKAAYATVLRQLDEIFPMKRVRTPNQQGTEVRNLPVHRFGQIIWGERTLLKLEAREPANAEEFIEKRLSDLAIIKVNKALRCEQNYLGEDIAFNEFDPALMFDNLYVRKVIDLDRNIIHVDEVDSDISAEAHDNVNHHGLSVFKYGSTTKFTKGNLNGIKLVYWLDGTIHSSEFVVNSLDNNSAFAAGGDSGAWILAKLEDCRGAESKGLGVVGMLHSYDGELKQFGLYTPMNEVLQRLEQVTNIKWGVVGVTEKDHVIASDGEVEEESLDSDYESSIEDRAFPPEID